MPERFAPLPGQARVFRLALRGSSFLPANATLPLPGWLEPTSADVEEATRRGRIPGVSVWDENMTSVADARSLTGRPAEMAFGLEVQACRDAGVRFGRALDVVADPLDDRAPAAGWEGHALIEGLKRPAGFDRRQHKDLLLELVGLCRVLS